jgi:hypothetical protein
MTASSRLSYISGLDGIRAIAVMAAPRPQAAPGRVAFAAHTADSGPAAPGGGYSGCLILYPARSQIAPFYSVGNAICDRGHYI